jgi:hypothetical protein
MSKKRDNKKMSAKQDGDIGLLSLIFCMFCKHLNHTLQMVSPELELNIYG